MPKTDNEAYPVTDAAAKKMKTDDDAADEIHAVPKRVQDGAHIVGMHNYLSKWEQSVNDPQTFWAKEAAERLDWIVPPKTVCRGDFAAGNVAWFPDGMLNVSVNCLDRHPPDHTAIIWEGDEPTEVKRITYGEALAGTCQLANALRARGVRKGDRVCLYMPMVPEAAYAMLACARIGAIHSVVFAGFSAEALRARIVDSQCKVVLTADEGLRATKKIKLKSTVDKALEEGCECVTSVLVHKRTGNPEIGWVEGRDEWMHEAMACERCAPRNSAARNSAAQFGWAIPAQLGAILLTRARPPPRLQAVCAAGGDERRGPSLPAVHVWVHRQAEGDDAHDGGLPAVGGVHPPVHLRLPAGRGVRVRRRHRLDHRPLVHRVRPAVQRGDDGDVRVAADVSRRRPVLGPDPAPQHRELLHGTRNSARNSARFGAQFSDAAVHPSPICRRPPRSAR